MKLVFFLYSIILSQSLYALNTDNLISLYNQRKCTEYITEVKKNWKTIPSLSKNLTLVYLAECAIETNQISFAESIIRHLEKKNENQVLILQVKSRLDLKNEAYSKITDEYEFSPPQKASLNYFINVAQSYYEQQSYDESLNLLSQINLKKLNQFQINLVRYWKAKNYFLKDEYEKSLYFVDLIETSQNKSWINEATIELKKSIKEKHKTITYSISSSIVYDDNANRESIQNTISLENNPSSYIKDGIYRFNPIVEYYFQKNKNNKKFFVVDTSFSWASVQHESDSQNYILKYKSSEKLNPSNTFSWEAGFSKSQLSFQDTNNDIFTKLGYFYLFNYETFLSGSFKVSKSISSKDKSALYGSLALFKIINSHLVYMTISNSITYDKAAQFSLSSNSYPTVDTGTLFSNSDSQSISLAYSYDLDDRNNFKIQGDYSTTKYNKEDLPIESLIYTNSSERRQDVQQTYSLSWSQKYLSQLTLEYFYSQTLSSSTGQQSIATSTFSNKNYVANQVGINIDWTYE